MMAQLALQYNIKGKLFLTPHVNVASIGFGDFDEFIDKAFSPEGSWQLTEETSALISAGVTASLNTFLGPIDFDVSWVNDIDKFRVFFGIGYQFNRSN
jgi:NTE family protein